MEISEETLTDIRRILEYAERGEEADYEQQDAEGQDFHIWPVIQRVRKVLGTG